MKKTTKRIIGQEGGLFSNFADPVLRICLPLIKNVHTPLAKYVLLPLGLLTATSATGSAVQNNIYGSEHAYFGLSTANYFNNFWQINGWYHENSQISWRIRFTD